MLFNTHWLGSSHQISLQSHSRPGPHSDSGIFIDKWCGRCWFHIECIGWGCTMLRQLPHCRASPLGKYLLLPSSLTSCYSCRHCRSHRLSVIINIISCFFSLAQVFIVEMIHANSCISVHCTPHLQSNLVYFLAEIFILPQVAISYWPKYIHSMLAA